MDTENTEEDMENMDCEQIKPVEEISPAPSYLPQNDQSIHQPKQQLRDRTPRKRRNKRLRPDETTSPAPSCTSLQSDQSIDRPIQFQKSAQNRVLRPDETTSRALSCTSLQSDQSIDRPIQFQKSAQNRVVRPDEATSPAPSCTSLQSDQSIDRPIQFQKCTQNRVLRPDEATSPAPSCTSLQSDQSIDRPIQFQKCTQNRVLRPDEATSPAPSCTSLQSDQSIDRPIQFQKSAQNRVLRPDETTSPAPSCTSLQSDQSIDRPIQFQKCTQNRVLRPDETTSPALSCTSLQSDQSIDRPIQFQKSAQNRVVRPDEATSPAPSCTSLQSDQSIDRPIQFQKCTQNRVLRPDETTSPAPSCTSLQSDQSIDRHIQFQKSAQNRVLRPDEATSPAPSCTSLQSDQSIDRPIQFQKSAQNRVIGKNVKEPFRRHDSSLRTEVMSPDISTFSATLLTEDHYRCSVCTEIFKNPVSIPCGHSYCKHCIEIYWNKPTQAECYACPQCRKRFRDRPVLNVNVALSKLIEELKRAGFSPALPSHCYAGPEDVSCDICSDMKLKAVKSCLTCDVSYCDTHIRQHYTVPALQRHNLIKPYNISSDSKIPTTSSAVTGFQETIKLLTTELIKVKSTLREKDSQAKRLCQGFEIHCNVFPSDIIEVAALGRPLCIGMLYDTESDSYSQTSFLWKDGIIASMRVSLPRPQTDVKVLDGDSLQDRFKALEMSSVLRSRALHGQVEMNGAAAFLNHPVQSEHQDRVTLHYKTTTRLDMISQTLLQEGVSPSLLNITTATHVIIAVSYGAQAFFVFDSKRISAETNTEIKNVIMKMMTTFSEQEILSCLTNTERDDSNLYTCNVYIDVGDWKSPVSFDKAVEIYSSLPELLGSKGERAVPLKVWLYPLKKLDKTSVCAALNGVSKGLMYRAENVLQHLNKQIRTCQDLMTSPDNLCVIIWFPALKDIFVKFSELLQKYQADFQEEITEIAEDIQVKEEEEERRIQHLLERHERSPFNAENISQWLENKDTELKILNDCKAADITVVKTQTEFQQIINHPQITRVMCFTLTSPDVEDSFLTALKQHIESDHITQTDSLQFKPVNISQKVLVDIQVYIASKETNENAEQTRFIAASLPDEGFPECSVRFYYEGRIVSRNIEFGVKPDLAQIDQIKHNSVSMKCDHLDKKDIERYVVEYQVVVDDEINTWKQTTVYADTFKGKCVLSGLEQDTEYQLRYAVCYNQRMSNFSWIVSLKTSSVARPGQPSVTKLSRDTLRVEWLKAEADEDCPVLHYMVEYKEAGLEGWSSVQTQASQCEYTLTTPHSTCYRVRVSAVYEHITSKPSEETSVPVDVWRINLSERKSSILLEVLKLQTEKKPVELIDWTHEESEVRGFLQCLPYISLLGFIEAPNESSELWKESKIFIKNLFLQAALCQKEIIETTVKMLLSSVDYGKCDFLLDLCSHVKNYERETGKSVLPALQSIYHQSSPEVWRINLSKRKSSILLEVLKLHTEKKPVELIDWTHEESEVRGFLQCLPYISQLRFENVFFEKRESAAQFVVNLFTAASEFETNTEEKYTELLTSVCNYTTFPFDEEYYDDDDLEDQIERWDFLLYLYSRVKDSETGKSVLPALQSIYHQSSPEVWRINLSERKSSILLEVLKLQTEKKPVELIDWTHEESEVRGFLQYLAYISQLRFSKDTLKKEEKKKSSFQFLMNLSVAASECDTNKEKKCSELLTSVCNYTTFPCDDDDDYFEYQIEQCDYLLDLCLYVKAYQSETGRSVLPALQSIYHQSSPEVWRINLSERKSSILLEVLKLQTEKKPVELRCWTYEESKVRRFLQCLPYISQLRLSSVLCKDKTEECFQFLVNLFISASEFDTNTGEIYSELLTSVCSHTSFPCDDLILSEKCDFLLDLCSHVKNYESETGRSVLPALQSIYHQSSPEVWTINLSERKSSILLEVLKLQTEKKPVELIDWTHEESEVRGFLQCLPYISELRSLLSSIDSFENQERRKKLLSFNLCLQEPSLLKEITESSLESLFSYIYHGNCDFLLDLCSHVKNYESETGRSVLPALQSIYHQSSPEVWRINLSERKSSILLEVLKLQTEKKPVELIDWTHEESEVRGFLQCLPYISLLRFIKPSNESSELWEKRKRLFVLDLCLQAALCQKEIKETTVKMLLSSVNYEKCDFLLDLYSHVKNYESETGKSVLPALQSIYHQSSPEVWRINLSERKSSILLEVLKLQTEKKPVELIDWTHEESEVRGFLQSLPYISQLRFIEPSNQSSELWKKSKILFIKNLILQAALCQKEIKETTVNMLLSSMNYEKCDFLLDLCSHVKNYESETGRSVLPALQSIYHQSSPEVWRINLSERKSSILLEVLKLQTEKKPVELIDWTHEESEVRGFLQCLPYISQLRFTDDLCQKRESGVQFLGNLFTAASEFDTNTEEKYTELLTSVCSYTTFPFYEEYYNEDDEYQVEQTDFLLDLCSHVKNYESETGRSVLPALQSIYHQSSPAMWTINLSERKSSILLEVLKLQTEKKPVELIDWTHEESEVRGFLQCLPYISQLRFKDLWCQKRESAAQFLGNLFTAASEFDTNTEEKYTELLTSVCSYTTFPFYEEYYNEDDEYQVEQTDFLLDLCSHVKNYESETGRSVLPALQSIYHQSSPEVWRINLSERKSSILLEVLKLQTEKKPVELIDWTHEESEVRGFLQCLPYISQLRFEQGVGQYKSEKCFQFLVNLSVAASEFDTNTEEKYTELLTSVCSYTTFPFDEENYNEDDEYQIYQCDFLLDLCSHVKNYESETGRSVLPALQSIYHQSSPEVWRINLSERKSSILLEVLKLQTEKKPVELIDWTHEESEVRGFLQCLPYISQLRFERRVGQYKSEKCFQFLVNLSVAASECETDTGEKYTKLFTSVCNYTSFPFEERNFHGFQFNIVQSDFLLDLYSHVKNYESETDRSVLPALQSIYHQSSPAMWTIKLSERKSSILLEVLKLQTEKKPVELIDWTHEESEVRGFLQCLPYISLLRNSEKCFPSVCKEFGLKVKRDQVTPLLQTVMFTVTLSGKLPSSTCRCVGRVLSLSPSTLNLTLKPQAISLRGVRSLFRHITHLQRLSLEDRMVMMMVRALRSFNGHSLLNTDELSVVTKDSKLTHSRIVSSLTSLLRRLSVRCLDLTECKLEAVSVTALLCLQGLQTIRLSEETSKKLVSVVCEAQDDELTRCFLEKVSKGLTSCSLTWKQIQYLLQHQTLDFDFRKSKISTENIRELLPCLGRVHLKRLTPSFVLSIIMEIYESRSPQYVSGLLSSAENLINLRNKVLNSVQCAALRFTLQHCNTVKLNLFWTSIPDEELKSFLPLLNRLTQLSVDRQLLLKLLHCCSSSDDQQEAADLLLSALHNRLDFSCCSIQDLTVTEENQNYLNLTNEDCKMISSVLQKNKSVVKLVLEDCKVSDTALKQLLPILSQVQLSCSKDLLLQFMTCISEDTEKGSVRWTRALSQALGEELDLSHTQMDQRACKQLAVFLEYSDGLTELDLSHCKLTDQYMETLLPHLHKTQTLDLSYNSITDELTNRIHSVVSTHNNIQTVRLFGNRIKDRKLFFRDKRFEIW
ncbi:uncharacterized protein si:ch211-281l24.3 isoform X2 [Triplophysa dalaica]|uniref:uncharacterized protein si:ch211-281l24.3 isoform X2 n=1 Tax=Triplophysa dalaica TaxID=1582913 RepID=UPI0024DFB15F|nr:uncharacterized protein si:ch211-281l24.3 isoform X2 [Triplophysa dalaica]